MYQTEMVKIGKNYNPDLVIVGVITYQSHMLDAIVNKILKFTLKN